MASPAHLWPLTLYAEAALTLLCALVTGLFFARRVRREAPAGRRTGALSLACVGVADIVQMVTLFTPRSNPELVLTVLPACVGQALMALQVWRQTRN